MNLEKAPTLVSDQDSDQALVRKYIAALPKLPVILLILAAALLLVSPTMQAQTQTNGPLDQLAKPPAGAQAFTILSTSGTNGKAFIWTADDGSRMSRDSILLRGQVWELDQKVVLGSDGMPSALVVRGVTPEETQGKPFMPAAARPHGRVPWTLAEARTLLRRFTLPKVAHSPAVHSF